MCLDPGGIQILRNCTRQISISVHLTHRDYVRRNCSFSHSGVAFMCLSFPGPTRLLTPIAALASEPISIGLWNTIPNSDVDALILGLSLPAFARL